MFSENDILVNWTWKWLPGRINSASHLWHRRVHDLQSLCSYTITELTQYSRGRYPFSVSDIGSLYNLNAINIHDCRIQGHAGKYQRIGGHLNSPRLPTPTLSRSSLCSVRQCPVVFGTLDVNSTDCSRNQRLRWRWTFVPWCRSSVTTA